MASSAYSNGRLGLNLGYTGSYQSGTAFNSAFGGAAFRLGRLAVGSAFRKLELASGDPLQVDVSGVFRVNRRIRLGASIYNLGEEQQVGLGVGFEKPLELTFQADILFPMNPKGNSLSDQYSANAVITSYYKRFAYSAGVRYNRQQDGFNNSNQLVANLGLNYRLTHYLNLSAQYQSNPQSLGIGIVWGWTPPADQYTKIFQEQI
ncbi:MAG: hypothetical protein EBZ49_10880 [Proteobacteria bacterium]|nr:hypothetical protein [Pseudomonadota bacterium]